MCIEKADARSDLDEMLLCTHCGQQRSKVYFEQDIEKCDVCIQKQTFSVFTCEGCGACTRFDDRGSAPEHCQACSPSTVLLECTVCKQMKDSMRFRPRDRTVPSDEQATIRRCMDCGKSCATCHKRIHDWRSFACNSADCSACFAKKGSQECDARSQVLPTVSYTHLTLPTT